MFEIEVDANMNKAQSSGKTFNMYIPLKEPIPSYVHSNPQAIQRLPEQQG